MSIAAVLGSMVNQPFRDDILNDQTGQFSSKNPRIAPSYFLITIGYLLWKCSVAIVFAFIFYLITSGGLVTGDLFPEFISSELPEGQTWNMEFFVKNVNPKQHDDVAKLLIWSFAAGYSERLVPNLLDKIISQAPPVSDLDNTSGGV